ncbi:MAG: hypothetical protein Q9162_000684 [Coniocarpon cinnabarinum]
MTHGSISLSDKELLAETNSYHGRSNVSPSPPGYGADLSPKHSQRPWYGVIEGFKRDPYAAVAPDKPVRTYQRHQFDYEEAANNTASSPLLRSLKSRHLQMIAFGGSIGTGLFVGSGATLSAGGPASVLIAFSLIGVLVYCTVQALGEMAVVFPVAGSFSAFSTRFLDPAWGFAMGWNYAMQWLVSLPLEIVSACYTISFWDHGRINNDAWVIIFLALIGAINFFGVKGYGEAEFIFAIIKITAIISFIVLGIVLVVAGSPEGGFLGGRYWHDPGAFNNGFKGLCSVFTNAAFAFGGTELVGLAAAETSNPRKSLPTAVKQVFWRVTLFYIVSLTLVGLCVPHNDPRLLSGASAADVTASPFVVAINNAGISVLPSVFNVVVLISVLSVGNSAVFGSSRVLAALAEQRQAPRILAYVDRRGRPLVAIILACVLGFLAFFAGSNKQHAAFEWMVALSGLSTIFTWGSICLAHIRFRRAWVVQGHSLEELAFTSQPGVAGSWVGLGLAACVLVAQFWTAIAPLGYTKLTTSDRVRNWFSVYLTLPIVIAFYLPYKWWFKTKVMRTHTMDLRTGMRMDIDLHELVAEERAERRAWSRGKKTYKFFC